jgi:thiol:disulfide interchange protein DsbA
MNPIMNPLRRKIVASLASLPLALAAGRTLAQGITAGTEYLLVSPQVLTESATKVEVIEFFSYACPHCYSFEPMIEPWIKSLPADVLFHRVPVVYHEPWLAPARLYYALEVLGEAGRLSPVVFDAMHKEHRDLTSEDAIAKFLESQGIPQKKFSEAYRSFSVETKMKRGTDLQAAYKIDQVPEIGVDGRYVTASSMVGGSHASVLPVVDQLIAMARKEHKLPKP